MIINFLSGMALNNQILYGSKATANVLEVCFNKYCDKITLTIQPHYLQPEMETVVHWCEIFGQKMYDIIPKCWYMLHNTGLL